MVFLGARRNFTQLWNLAGKLIDITHGEVDFRFLRRRQQVKYGVSRSTHRDIQRHGVFKRRFASNIARQCTFVVLLVVTFGQFNNALTSIEEQLLAIGVGRQQRAVARLRQAQCFGQAIHRVSGKHPGARSAGWTGGTFNLIALGVRNFRVCALDHRINQIEFDYLIGQFGFPGLHRAAGNKDHRNIQAQGSHQHPRGDFVAVRDADHGVGAVGVDHILNGISDQFARWQ